VNPMMPVGPEALMVQSKTDARVELAEFLQLEYRRGDARALAAGIGLAPEVYRSRRPAIERLRLWLRGPVGRAVRSSADHLGADARSQSLAPLAALPAARAGMRPEEGTTSLSAIPALTRS
jgi:hypothetical protein